MYPKIIKLILSILTISYSILQFYYNNIGNGIALIFLASMFIFLYFKNEIILIIFLKLRKQDFIGTEKWLKKIKNPESSLTKKQVGYYNYLWGIVTSQTNLTILTLLIFSIGASK